MSLRWGKSLKFTRRIETVYGVFLIFIIALSVGFFVKRSIKTFQNFIETSHGKAMWYRDIELTQEEKARIDQWIEINNLNKFGEPKDKVYTSFPLVNAVTGERISRYKYILSKHPHRPWRD